MERRKLVLVDYENVHKVDLSVLDDSYSAIIFVGVNQDIPKAARKESTAHRFRRAHFRQVVGAGKNALDFHIAFQLGRTFETSPSTICIVLSRDKGFDPLLQHLNSVGFECRRVDSLDELTRGAESIVLGCSADVSTCSKCGRSSTIEHHGGRWCSNCGRFSTPPDYDLLPSNQKRYHGGVGDHGRGGSYSPTTHKCDWCYQSMDMGDGIYDDGEWMCGACISGQAR